MFSSLQPKELHRVISFVSSAQFAVSALPSEAIYPPSTAARANSANGCRNQRSASKGYGRFRAYPGVDERVFAASARTWVVFGFGCGSGQPLLGEGVVAGVFQLSELACLRPTAAAARCAVSQAYPSPFSWALLLFSSRRAQVSATLQPQSIASRQNVKSTRLTSGRSSPCRAGAFCKQRS